MISRGGKANMRSLVSDPEVILEPANDRAHSISHCEQSIFKRIGHMDRQRNLVDSYIKGEIGIHVNVRMRREVSDFEGSDSAFIFEYLPPVVGESFDAHVIG